MARLTSRFQIDLLLRHAQAAGGFAMVLHKGDEHGGAMLVQCRERGACGPLLERRRLMDDRVVWDPVGPPISPAEPQNDSAQSDYLAKRLRGDPDLWVVELDIANAAQLVATWLSNA